MTLDKRKYPSIPNIPLTPATPIPIPKSNPNICFTTNNMFAISYFDNSDSGVKAFENKDNYVIFIYLIEKIYN
jgi:hypothetical protein